MTFKHKLITIAVIGLTYGAWFTLDTGGAYTFQLLFLCAGLFVSLLCFLVALSINVEEPHKRFKHCRRIEL